MSKRIEEYSAAEVEAKGIKDGEDKGVYSFRDNGNSKKLYILDMFPYPSGAGLHVGHIKGYLATDILTRFYTMKGHLVFHPMGWDAFGLPAEQYAIKTGNCPAEFTQQNINNFRKQLKRLMFTYDFDYEVDTSSPSYYKHTQGIFSEMYKRGLASLVDTQVNGCEALNTVLSDEEIIVDEQQKLYSERGNHPVVRKTMKQWILKITKYADELLEGIPTLEGPDNVKRIQQDGIGISTRYEFPVQYLDKVYPLYLKYASSIRELKGIGIHQFSELSKRLGVSPENTGDKEIIQGIYLINLVDHQKIPVFYMGDIDFRAEELIPLFSSPEEEFYDESIENFYLRKERVPTRKTVYKLKDGVFSRQRFGGEPIPILFDENGDAVLDPALPVVLPKTVDYKSQRDGKSPLANDKEGLTVIKGGNVYTRETNTMPNWAGSSGYFMAYLLKKPGKDEYYDLNSPEAKEILNRGLPVDIYVGGQEHAAMHLLYARFGHKFLKRIGIVDSPEPFKTLLNQGMVLGADGTKMSKSKGNYVSIDEVIDKYGADTLRIYEAFSGPTQLSFKGDDEGLRGSHKGMHKVYIFFHNLDSYDEVDVSDNEVSEIENKLISNVESCVPILKINLGVSEMMIFLNEIQKIKKYHLKALRTFVQILSLYAPALAEELGRTRLEQTDYLFKSTGPTLNEIVAALPEYKIFINGKFKFVVPLVEEDLTDDYVHLRERVSELTQGIENCEVKIVPERELVLVISSNSSKKDPS